MSSRLSVFLAIAVVPLALFVPIFVTGGVFLPLLPGGLEPLASEHPGRAAEAFEDASFNQSDRIFPVLTDQLAMQGELLRGSIPSWEPNLGLGYPLHGGSIAGLTYPPNLLGTLAGPVGAAGPLAALALLLAGLGAYLFFRRLGYSKAVSLIGVLTYQLGGFGLANLFYGMKVDAALWLPWMLYGIEGLRTRERGSALVLGLAVALSFLSGFVTISAFALTLAGVWAVIRLVRAQGAPARDRETSVPRLVTCGLATLAGLAIAAVGVLPFVATKLESVRTQRTTDDLYADSLPASPHALLGLVVRDFVDEPTSAKPNGTQPVAWWITPLDQVQKADGRSNSLEWNLYAGLGVVLLALVGLFSSPRRALVPWSFLLVTLGFAQGWPLLRELYGVPGFNLGSPGRVLGVTWFLWPWCAVVGVAALSEVRARQVLALLALVAVAGFAFLTRWAEPAAVAEHIAGSVVETFGPTFEVTREDFIARVGGVDSLMEAGARLRTAFLGALAAAVAVFLAALALIPWNRPLVPAVLGALSVAAALAPPFLVDMTDVAGAPIEMLAASAVVLFGVVVTAVPSVRPLGRWLPLALVLLIEGLLGASGHVTAREEPSTGLFPEDSPAMQAIVETAAGGRVLRYDPEGVASVEALARPNFLQPYGVGDLCSWIVFTPRWLVELAGALDPRPQFDMRFRSGIAALRNRELIGHPVFDALNVTCILSRAALEDPRLELTYEANGFYVYRRSGALGTAWVVPHGAVALSDEAAVALMTKRLVKPAEIVVLPEGSPIHPAVDSPLPSEVEVTRGSKRTLTVEVRSSPGGWLVVSEQWAPGWVAELDGEEVPIHRANHTMRAVRIPEGASTVEFVYAPASLELSVLLLSLGLVALFFVETRLTYARGQSARSTSR